jgi:MOSC domain-containing protein YiiM
VHGEIARIWIKRFKRGPMDPVDEATLVAGRGLAGNANQGGRRQVTLLDEGRWAEAQEAVGAAVDPSVRRANILLRGIDLERSHRRLLRIGTAIIRIHTETRPCERMEEAHPGLQAALSPRWRGGANGQVIEGGVVRVGDRAEWVAEDQQAFLSEAFQ